MRKWWWSPANTASALGLPRLREVLSVPVEGVIEPGVEAALAATVTGHVAVLGTKATIGSGAYAHALEAARPGIRVTSLACPLLVPLVEEGLFEDALTDAVLHRYMAALRAGDADALVMGCTHYPLLATALARAAGPAITLVDSAANCARTVARRLDQLGLRAPSGRAGSLDLSFTDPPGQLPAGGAPCPGPRGRGGEGPSGAAARSINRFAHALAPRQGFLTEEFVVVRKMVEPDPQPPKGRGSEVVEKLGRTNVKPDRSGQFGQ